ncbi:hypothetical protein K7395_23070 [Streptomyces filamentosus]|uniref:DUF3558 domain-containing protein n=2 Tax=Streptomyces filamentosus TaxID=67294 RepID=A0ABY4UYH2_STRFL|nr:MULTISPECIES: hypothetical protein [Streptomyces]MYR79007.1 hypothetical protein [Streptomyces sp. SID5466]EFE74910.1 predicted protein [Streptomyces filamentosus NRRL 15998]ESU47634.1 hypothetical protein P376_4383 [Streptomyces sp. HCCB10043]EWS91986.1 hypothetical protein SSIG_02465 [Streptomyces filamentosus NRRL 11379]USC49396.1 hypothetical protein K7395_23070 [Streptomyces filamentosus]
MISEPELVGEDGPGSSSDVVSGFDPEQGPGGGGRRRWHGALWGVAGALTASAVWAAAVFGYGIGVDGKPDARGYSVESDSCAAMELKELARALGKPESEPATELDGIEHPALHRIRCTVDFEELDLGEQRDEDGSGWYVGYRASLTAELHKESDPRPEFEASSTVTDIDGTTVDRVERVPDLGDSAYLQITDDSTMRLNVVEGGAVITLALSVWMSYNEGEGGDGDEIPDAPEEPEMLAYRGHLINDMRDVMKGLKTG